MRVCPANRVYQAVWMPSFRSSGSVSRARVPEKGEKECDLLDRRIDHRDAAARGRVGPV